MNKHCEGCQFRKGNNCLRATGTDVSVHNLTHCPIGLWGQTEDTGSGPAARIAPFRTGPGKRWEGSAPWANKLVTVILPVIEYNETLDLTLECLRRQTIEPLIIIVDTGSVLTTDRIVALRDAKTEVIQMRMQGWYHPSWPVAAGLDAAWACVNTPYVFFTHDDCFIKQQDTFQQLIVKCQDHPAVGFRITERDYPHWMHDFGHTFLMLDVKEMDQIPLTWNMRAYQAMTGVSCNPELCKQGFPDTETMMNHLFRLRRGWVPGFEAVKGQPLFLGTPEEQEQNFQRNENSYFDHCRSMTCSFLYAPDYYAKAIAWTKSAMDNCRKRLEVWK